MGGIREFSTGASRDTDAGKLDLEGFLSPLVLERYGQYMHDHRKLPDGSYRDADNWQKGIPHAAYMKSGWRHFFDWWKEHRGIATGDGMENALCALIFNASGYLHERIKSRQPEIVSHARAAEILRDMTLARIEQDDDAPGDFQSVHEIQYGAGGEVIDVTKGPYVPNWPSNEDGS